MVMILTVWASEFAAQSTVDETLIAAIAEGDTEALRHVYGAVSASVYGFALSITKNAHDAEDVLQDTFVTIYEKAATYQPQGKPLAWILTIARNHALMRIRSRKREASFEDEVSDNSLAFSRIEQPEERWAVETLLSLLNEEERQIVVLHAVAGLKNREIAAVMKLPLGTVLSKYNRAVKKLKAHREKENIAYENI